MYTEQDLKDYGVAYFVFNKVRASAYGEELIINPVIVFQDKLYTAEAKAVSNEVWVVIRDYFSTEVLGELKAPEELLKLFKMRSNGN